MGVQAVCRVGGLGLPCLSCTPTRVAGASGPGGVSAAPGSCYPGQKLTPSSSSHPFPQFPDIVEFCENMANSGKTVIVAALDGTFQRKVKCLVQVLGWDWGRRGLGRAQNWTAQPALDAHTMPEPRHSGQPDPAPGGDPDSTCLGWCSGGSQGPGLVSWLQGCESGALGKAHPVK